MLQTNIKFLRGRPLPNSPTRFAPTLGPPQTKSKSALDGKETAKYSRQQK